MDFESDTDGVGLPPAMRLENGEEPAMTPQQEHSRRSSIRMIMADESLSALEKRKSIQSLMDGRRRSSAGTASSLGDAAREAASYYTESTEEGSVLDGSSGQFERMEISAPAPAPEYGYGAAGGGVAAGGGSGGSENGGDDNGQMMVGGVSRRQRRSASLPGWSDSSMPSGASAVAAASSNKIWDDPINISRRMEKSRPACSHYERNCTIVSPCCGVAFGCRICHDECPVLPMPFSKRRPEDIPMENRVNWTDTVESSKQRQLKRRSLPLGFEEEETHHEIDRFEIGEIICRLCYTRQSSKTNFCTCCHAQFGAYHCKICNLWMSDDESPYHCEKCGFCRVGGRENFRHCDDCGMCIDRLLFDDHNCKAGKYMSNCPVCQEDLFSSRDASHEMPCGHAIHWHCFKELTSYDTRCPVCKKTAETPEHMAPTWEAMAMGIALQPVPPELARCVTIICNDCETVDHDRRWHFLGVRCMRCMSFNTSVERTSLMGREAAAYMDELDRQKGSTDEPMQGS
ncbi:unnamed protein product [Cylindrotheca closterium]|uniref:RING finger and CHY zinc finger domain-containing protein 1 n=1 Tax=Cylindrotheca closterium TaxID=2856 RepID=A0AAD2FNZ8_9STRA|nr:unnamed protein product [Cylindrotheca closterium]